MLMADPLNVCEIMLNIHCKKIRSFGGRLEVAHRLQTFSHALTLRGLMTSMAMLLFARFMQQIPLFHIIYTLYLTTHCRRPDCKYNVVLARLQIDTFMVGNCYRYSRWHYNYLHTYLDRNLACVGRRHADSEIGRYAAFGTTHTTRSMTAAVRAVGFICIIQF